MQTTHASVPPDVARAALERTADPHLAAALLDDLAAGARFPPALAGTCPPTHWVLPRLARMPAALQEQLAVTTSDPALLARLRASRLKSVQGASRCGEGLHGPDRLDGFFAGVVEDPDRSAPPDLGWWLRHHPDTYAALVRDVPYGAVSHQDAERAADLLLRMTSTQSTRYNLVRLLGHRAMRVEAAAAVATRALSWTDEDDDRASCVAHALAAPGAEPGGRAESRLLDAALGCLPHRDLAYRFRLAGVFPWLSRPALTDAQAAQLPATSISRGCLPHARAWAARLGAALPEHLAGVHRRS